MALSCEKMSFVVTQSWISVIVSKPVAMRLSSFLLLFYIGCIFISSLSKKGHNAKCSLLIRNMQC